MSTSTKILLGAVVVLALAGVGGTFWTGKEAEKEFRAYTDTVNSMNVGVGVKLAEYKRGFFSAKARTEWTFALPGEEPLAWFFNHDIKHGPLMAPASKAVIRSSFELSEDIAEALAEVLEKNPFEKKALFSITSTFGLGNSISHRIDAPSFEAASKVPGEGRVTWLGLSGTVNGGLFTGGKGEMVMNGLSVVMDDGDTEMRVGRGVFNSTQGKTETDSLLPTFMKGNFVVDEVSFRFKDDYSDKTNGFSLDKPRVDLDMSIKDGLVGLQYKYGIDKLVVESDSTTTVEKLGVTVLYENFDAQVIEAFLKTLSDQAKKGADDSLLDEAMMTTLQEQAKAFLQRKPAISLKDVSATWKEGDTKGNLRVAYDGDGNIESFSPADIAVDLTVSVPRALIAPLFGADAEEEAESKSPEEDAEERSEEDGEEEAETPSKPSDPISELKKLGLLVEKDGILSIEAAFKKGELTINGQSKSPEELQGLLPF